MAGGVTGVDEVAGTPGRRGVGTVNHCMHGKDAIVEEVLDWEPFDHFTLPSQLPIPAVPKLVSSYVFEELEDGRTAHRGSAADAQIGQGSGDRHAVDADVRRAVRPAASRRLKPLVEADAAAARADAAARPSEPPIPPALRRNVRQPVAAASVVMSIAKGVVRRPIRGAAERAVPARGEPPMRYLLLIYTTEPTETARSEPIAAAEMQAYNAFTEDVRARGLFEAGEALHADADRRPPSASGTASA